MRETKYRAWDKKLKEMFPVHELVFNRFDGEPITIKGYTHDEKDVWNVHGGHKMMYANAPRYELLEYTGFMDKNDKEIFEGDIICFGEDPTQSRAKMTVAWLEAGFVLTAYQEDWVYDLRECIPSTLEIIGNIYENPELLGGSE
ncbi:YopX family protein [Lysinibacillus sp. CD3-6]|uniref:YopX family protein n=1 Tax=Lysinibacillus sp. CD3-6 TaxID=2892541 RepID=UPI0011206484|nr:YopX family protein [Lysinibacillus sp. CD3-6]UED81924.1 YopX family protein [Lysinibacillus sp. CD3-6]